MQNSVVIEPARVRLLTVGSLVFTALEAGTGSLVLLIHGFPDGPETYSHRLTALAEAGFCAVAVMLRGYEDSSSLRCLLPDRRPCYRRDWLDECTWRDEGPSCRS